MSEGLGNAERMANERAYRDAFAQLLVAELKSLGFVQSLALSINNPLYDRRLAHTFVTFLLSKVSICSYRRVVCELTLGSQIVRETTPRQPAKCAAVSNR